MALEMEFRAFVASNVLVLLVGGVLAALSYLAFRRNEDRAFRVSAGGFVLITAGALAEAVYEICVRGTSS